MCLASAAVQAEEVYVPRGCPADVANCVMVDLNLVWPNRTRLGISQHPLVIEDTPTAQDQYRTTRLAISGRLNGQETALHDVVLERFYGGMDCQDFAVPAIGFGEHKGGIILTDKGPLEITQRNIDAGCDTCVALIDTKENNQAYFRQTPTWDQSVARHSVFKKDGGVYWVEKMARKENGRRDGTEATCFDLNSGPYFKVIDAKSCAEDKVLPIKLEKIKTLMDALPRADKNRLKHDLSTIKGTPYYFYKYGISCS